MSSHQFYDYDGQPGLEAPERKTAKEQLDLSEFLPIENSDVRFLPPLWLAMQFILITHIERTKQLPRNQNHQEHQG
ncbi:hypothetical protein NECAME_08065 [Necator americanus]|uniref:Uncharacterized protein n=1 Tax=Necator americanus TaxID=51031 RepID=W2TMJ8_NECAM|nr:hypothetical protein NECAME_08065 [Necator americanus]ETN82242.1 hypothetical protein NECAME_08065 [Necator americanus]